MAQPLTTPSNRPTGATIPGASAEAGITRTIATPGATAGETKGLSRRALTPMVALAAMTAAALADPSAPTRLSESQLDTITAGLNIDTPNFFAVTGCNTCIQYKENSGTNRLAASYAISFDDADSGSAAGYAGPLGILALGAANGNSLGLASAGGQDADGIAYAGAQAGGGQGVAGVYNGPLGILKVGAAAAKGAGAQTNAETLAASPLSLENLGGTLNVPLGGGKNGSVTLMVGIGVPGL